MGFAPYRFIGNPAVAASVAIGGGAIAVHSSEVWARTSAVPDGYAVGGAWVLPIIGGSRAARIGNEAISSGVASGAAGINGAADCDPVSSGTATGQAVFPGDGVATGVSSGTASGIGLAIGSAAAAAVSVGSVSGQALFSSEASGAAISSGVSQAGALAWGSAATGAGELTAQSIAIEVWSAIAAANNDPGTMGDLLNAAGGGGISGAVIDQIAGAVWAWAETVTPGSKGDELAKALRAAKLAAALSA